MAPAWSRVWSRRFTPSGSGSGKGWRAAQVGHSAAGSLRRAATSAPAFLAQLLSKRKKRNLFLSFFF